MPFLTEADLRSMSQGNTRSIFKMAESIQYPNVFLSHSSKDEDLMAGAIALLQAHGGKPYIDRRDPSLPATPSPKTGAVLRTKISSCPRFVLLVSKNSSQSVWVPWELGIADGLKGESAIALLPTSPVPADESWVSNEYLGLYPRIEPYNGRLIVWSSVNMSLKDLRDWIRGEE